MKTKPRLLTGDTPTGQLHLGHWVGSLENRVKLQDEYDCYFLLANTHAFTTRAETPEKIHQSVLEIALDYLSAGIDPKKSTIFIETEAPAILELSVVLSMLVPYPRAMRNPTIKDEIRDRGMGENYSLGFLFYQVMQAADILAFQAEVVPVGEDQIPHLELTREIARKFNQLYCAVDPHTADEKYVSAGGLFPIPKVLVGRVKRLVGTGTPDAEGRLLKMSKSLGNAILLSDDNDTVRQKIMNLYTDPKRLKASDPGTIENNPLWIFHDAFNTDTAWIEEYKARYQAGKVGDVECKKKLIEILIALLEPIHARRKIYANDNAELLRVLREGSARANEITQAVWKKVKEAVQQVF